MNYSVTGLLKKILNKQSLSFSESEYIMDEVIKKKLSDVQIATYLTGLVMKGETLEEISGFISSVRKSGTSLEHEMDVLELAGTGGDSANSFNISTTSMMIVAAAGVKVAKHGNKSASSKCGSADCLEALGVDIYISPEKSIQLLNKIGLTFLFAQDYYPCMKDIARIRREMGIHTIFNIIGPLLNPAKANMHLMGVYDERLVRPLAQILFQNGIKTGMVVYGQDRIDEISMSSMTTVCEIRNGCFYDYEICPEDFGYKRCNKEELIGGRPEVNAQITKSILSGTRRDAKRDTVCLNAGAALYIAGKTKNIYEGVRYAERLIDSGEAFQKLMSLIKESNEYIL